MGVTYTLRSVCETESGFHYIRSVQNTATLITSCPDHPGSIIRDAIIEHVKYPIRTGTDLVPLLISDSNGVLIKETSYVVKSTNTKVDDYRSLQGGLFTFSCIARRSSGSGTLYVRLYDTLKAVTLAELTFTETKFTQKQASFIPPVGPGQFSPEIQAKVSSGQGKLQEGLIQIIWS